MSGRPAVFDCVSPAPRMAYSNKLMSSSLLYAEIVSIKNSSAIKISNFVYLKYGTQ